MCLASRLGCNRQPNYAGAAARDDVARGILGPSAMQVLVALAQPQAKNKGVTVTHEDLFQSCW